MKTKSKALLLALCAVLLVAASVLGTMAYLTSQDKVTNTFTVGSVSITLDEAKVNADGTYVTGKDNRTDENDYHLLPGHEYIKDPVVHVDANSEECYLFVTIYNAIAEIEATGDTTVAAQMTENGWNEVGTTADGTLYVYGTVEEPTAVAGGDNKPVFTTFKIDGDVTNTALADYEGETIVVTAYAVQMDGFEDDTATDIWNTAFGTPALQG